MHWIFQGNPDQFDIDSYLQDFGIVNWTVRQKHYAPEMEVGDRVFFWRASGKAKLTSGVVAVGEIIDGPRILAEDAAALKYWKVAGGDAAELRVRIKVTHCLPVGAIYSKESIASNPALAGLAIITSPRQTNYKIAETIASALFRGFIEVSKQDNFEAKSSHSWTVESSNSAFKILDKSAFISWGSGIPIPVRPFFINGEMVSGEKRFASLVFNGKAYPAHIDMERASTARTRLFWNSEFTALLKETFPYHYQQYSKDQNPESQVILRLKRLSGFESYEVSFAGDIPKKDIEKDIESEELEEKGPQKEGRVKEYYGKRYERSPINRQQAIKHHGLSCNACGFNFEKVYGARGSDYIEVHHIKPIHTYEEEQHVDPKTDLTTVCANCHRMMHRDNNNILGLQELKLLISNLKADVYE